MTNDPLNARIGALIAKADEWDSVAVDASATSHAQFYAALAHALAMVRVAEALERSNVLLEESLNRNYPERSNGHAHR